MLLRYEGLNVNAPKKETKLMPSHIPYNKMNFSPQENAKFLPLAEERMAEYGIFTRKSYKTTKLILAIWWKVLHIFFTSDLQDVWCGWVDPLKNQNFYINPCFWLCLFQKPSVLALESAHFHLVMNIRFYGNWHKYNATTFRIDSSLQMEFMIFASKRTTLTRSSFSFFFHPTNHYQ